MKNKKEPFDEFKKIGCKERTKPKWTCSMCKLCGQCNSQNKILERVGYLGVKPEQIGACDFFLEEVGDI